jgi:UDP-N-acetylglucosamine--N-acetylmuramyl-(pentapeptide) pyrophosphoryl-undecaprenol N-acetylglucosamine transferase
LLAVADALRSFRRDVRLVCVGTERGLESRLVPAHGYELELIDVKPIRGAGAAGALRGVASAALSLPRAAALIKRYRPSAVFSVGGYAAGPITLAARALRLPVALLEPNADIGLANRWVAPLVTRAYLGFGEARRFFHAGVVLETGVPLRPGFSPSKKTESGSPLQVLVLGGSQGAKSLNEAVPEALARLDQSVSIVHQCGGAHEAQTRAIYASLALPNVQVVPFLDDVPAALAAADLVIGRAGASALAEICAVGRASLLVPYPYAGDHQRFNALSLEARGAALCVRATEATPARLRDEIQALLAEPGRLERMADAARALGKLDAAHTIARDLLAVAGLASEGQAFQSEPEAQIPPETFVLSEVA